ncbi:MAG TPA: UPF0182 family protein [Elusimicrobiota bacterium]|nr:UPF0182 family protein [Elusimicrobiota bacterium]
MSFILVVTLGFLLARILLASGRKGGFPVGSVVRDVVLALAFLLVVSQGSSFAVSYSWWRKLGQLSTFWRLLAVQWLPQSAAALVGAAVLALTLSLSKRRLGDSFLFKNRLFSAAAYVAALVLGFGIGMSFIDPWVCALWRGAPAAVSAYRDPLFQKGLGFYFFRLPFYEMLAGWLGILALAVLGICSAVQVADLSPAQLQAWAQRLGLTPARESWESWEEPRQVHPKPVRFSLAGPARAGAALFFIFIAVMSFFNRYSLLYSQHQFLYGADYVDAMLGIPFYWARCAFALTLALLALAAPRRKVEILEAAGVELSPFSSLPRWFMPVMGLGFAALLFLPPLTEAAVRSLYVKPNELTLEQPYIAEHIAATLSAYDLAQNAHEEPFIPKQTDTLNIAKYPDVAQNILLWDHRPFLDNADQLQTLRPYYTFPSVATDRYLVNGEMRQVLISPRGLDTDLLPGTAQTWVNLNLQYTHGYGAVASLVGSATSEGAPDFDLRDAPVKSDIPALDITRPQIYFGEKTENPVFVDSDQQEFDYPKGDDNAYNTYDGTGGISIGSWPMRIAAAVSMSDWNILLTRYLTPSSKMLIHRQIMNRVSRLAPFLTLDPHPYLVIDGAGRLFWMLDAYTSSDLNPDSQPTDFNDGTEINYIRNSVKITVDAYNGTVHFYVFDKSDPLLEAYRKLFPSLFLPRSAMPPDLLAHIRYPEFIFNVQSQIYRIYHMRDPQVFYNKEDVWDVAKQLSGQEGSRPTNPYYVMVRLPGDTKAEFVLMLPFTSHNRDNLIAWIAARCDPKHYGQIIFYRLPKDQLIYGPLQIQSRVNQNRSISKDLSLWNQQGTRVVRGNTRVLPVGDTFLYVEPIYIQATQAKLPELKKIVLGVGDRLAYSDTLSQAIAELAKPESPSEQADESSIDVEAPPPAAESEPSPFAPSGLIESLKEHMARYRQLTSEGRLSEAGQELEALQQELGQTQTPKARPPRRPRHRR